MKPKNYIDIASGEIWLDQMWLHLHCGMAEAGKGDYAVAFPKHEGENALMRVYADSAGKIEKLISTDAVTQLMKVASFSDIQTVDADYTGPWTRFGRFNIPSVKSDRHRTADGFSALHARRVRESRFMLKVPMISVTSGARFNLIVDRDTQDTNAGSAECLPDGYGLSVSSRKFWLPCV